MPLPEMQEAVFQGFMGLNRRTDRLNTAPTYLYDHVNGYIKKDATDNLSWVTQRTGSSPLNSIALTSAAGGSANLGVKTIYEAKWNGGTNDIIIRASQSWWKYNGVNAFTTIVTGRIDNVIGQACMYQNNLILTDGGIPQKCNSGYTVAAISADPAMPQDSTVCWVHGDKLWLNSASQPMKAYYSNTNDAFSYNSTTGIGAWSTINNSGLIDLSTVLPVGDTILAFRTLGGTTVNILAIICQKYTVLYLAGSDPTQFQVLRTIKSSCLSGNAIDYIGGDICYPSINQLTTVYSAYQQNDLETTSMTKHIEPYYRQLVSELITVGAQGNISGVFDKTLNHYYLTLPITGGYQTLVYSVDIGNVVGRWTYPFNIYSWAVQGNGTMLAGSDGYVYIINTGLNDNGTAIQWSAQTPALYFGAPQRYKKPVEFEVLLQATNNLTLQLSYSYNLQAINPSLISTNISISGQNSFWDQALWDVSYWDNNGNTLFNTPSLQGRGRGMYINLNNNTINALISLPWFVIRYNLEGRN